MNSIEWKEINVYWEYNKEMLVITTRYLYGERDIFTSNKLVCRRHSDEEIQHRNTPIKSILWCDNINSQLDTKIIVLLIISII